MALKHLQLPALIFYISFLTMERTVGTLKYRLESWIAQSANTPVRTILDSEVVGSSPIQSKKYRLDDG